MPKIELVHSFVKECNNKENLLSGVYTLNAFMKNIEQEAINSQYYIDIEQFKGKTFECFIEFLIKSYPNLWISNYTPNLGKDTGVDGYGIGLNGKPATVQIKYRNNKTSELCANEDHLSNFGFASQNRYGVDINDTKNMIVFTTAKDLHYYTEQEMLLNKVICVGYKEICQLIDNNIPFWDSFREAFYDKKVANIKPTPKKLYKHQKEALNAINTNNKGIINLPTGSGKTTIIARSIIERIKNNGVINPIIIASPRIILTKQILTDIQFELLNSNIKAQYCVVNSGDTKEDEDIRELEKALGFTHYSLITTTIPANIKKIYNRAKKNNLPLIICAVYNSVARIKDTKLPVDVIYCDEAHYLLDEQFNYITDDKEFKNANKYYFTATLRETISDEGLGMNNTNKYGKIIYKKSPAEMIKAGVICRPRLHIISTVNSFIKADATNKQKDAIDPHAIIKAFEEHQACCHQYSDNGAKLLVICKGTEHLEGICKSKYMTDYCKRHKNLTLFAITSKYGAKIIKNGIITKVSREDLLDELQALKSEQNAIIFHIDILSEGIDVPGITGILPLCSMKNSKMLQNLGRATRLDPEDRIKLRKKGLSTDFTKLDEYGQSIEALKYNKPYAYIIVPHYTESNFDLKEMWKDLIYNLRQYGFNPKEDVIITEKRGTKIPTSVQNLNQTEEEVKGITAKIIPLINEIEKEEETNRFYTSLEKCKTLAEISKLCIM